MYLNFKKKLFHFLNNEFLIFVLIGLYILFYVTVYNFNHVKLLK